MSSGVLVALSSAAEPAVVARLDAPGSGLRVVRRCADLTEVLAAVDAGLGSVAVVEPGRGVDRGTIAAMHQRQVVCVVVCHPEDVVRSQALGADAVVPSGGLPSEVAEAVSAAISGLLADHGPADPAVPASAPPGPPPERMAGRLVAVWGTPGAPGRTTIALNLGAELASSGASTLLADADTVAPSLAQALGVMEESAALAALCRAASQGVLDAEAMVRRSPFVGSMRFCSGLTRADRWRELAPVGLEVVWERAREIAEWVVVDLAAPLEVQDGWRGAPERTGATRATLEAADDILVVVPADPIGVRRAVASLGDLDDAGVTGTRHVVVTKVRAHAAGPRPAESVTEALVRFAGIAPVAFVPDDRVVCDSALLAGVSLAEHAPRSPARTAIRELALSLAGREEPSEGRRHAFGRLGRRARRVAAASRE